MSQNLVKYLKRLAATKPEAAADANNAVAELIRYKMKTVGHENPLHWERVFRNAVPPGAMSPANMDGLVQEVGRKISRADNDAAVFSMGSPSRGQLWGTAARQHGRAADIEKELWQIDPMKILRMKELQGRFENAKRYGNQVDKLANRLESPPPDMLDKFLKKYTTGDTSQPLDLIAAAKKRHGK